MSIVTRAVIERIARLAALEVEPEALPVLTQQIGQILEYVSRLEAVDMSRNVAGGVWLSAGPLQTPRPDTVHAADLAAGPDAFAPAFDDHLFVVPRLSAIEDL